MSEDKAAELNAGTFDLGQWLSGTIASTKYTCKVRLNLDAFRRVVELQERGRDVHAALTQATEAAEKSTGSGSLGEVSPAAEKVEELRKEFEALKEEHDKARAEEAKEPPRRVAQKGSSRSAEVAAEMVKVREQMESGWLTFRVRGLDSDELDRVNKVKDPQTKVARALSIQVVEPPLTEAQAKALRDKIGVGQFAELLNVANRVAYDKVATPDFSAGVYATIATQGS